MKLRTTTPASASLHTRVVLFVVAIFLAVLLPIQMVTRPAAADQYDERISTLQKEIEAYKAEANRLNSQASTLQSALAQLATQKNTIQAQIDINQAKHDQLVIQIADTEQQIKDNRDALGVTIADLYVDDQISPLEMLASSTSVSDYLDKQEYRSSVRDQLSSTITKIKELKAQLDQQKADVDKVLADQKDQKAILVAKEAEQQNLLASTQGQEANYQKMISSNEAKIIEAKATQAIINSRINGTGGYTLVDSGSLGDYPWNASNCPMWGYLSTGGSNGNGGDGRGYGCRQCASYVAWRFAKETGIYPSWGNAVDFTNNAKSLGYVEGGPQAGSIAVMDPASAGQSYGHVAWVEAVNGGQVLVSQYNYNYGAGYGMYSMMWLSAGAFDHYIHIL
ncbi:MAG TPA: CHAP domain-containing protein [Candidatus Saccharibacteria bacterium]|nr:CHAP domain-containing protein [Candidatus Saccharibacteria bacterium]